jgi:hypothetical protein
MLSVKCCKDSEIIFSPWTFCARSSEPHTFNELGTELPLLKVERCLWISTGCRHGQEFLKETGFGRDKRSQGGGGLAHDELSMFLLALLLLQVSADEKKGRMFHVGATTATAAAVFYRRSAMHRFRRSSSSNNRRNSQPVHPIFKIESRDPFRG